jgi:nitroimidazol reductase NimA-like FMN-containing flavoprotein (pyridoxamine 5'-phosphate oxidase superfamily)
MSDVSEHQSGLGNIARAVIDANLYMVLGTAGEDGRPWVTPVYYSAGGYTDFYWVSRPEAVHSRNIAARPQVSIVIFNSQTPIGTLRPCTCRVLPRR